MTTSADRYTRTAIGLHWLMAAALATLFCVGLYMHGLPLSPRKLRVFNWHKWAGFCLFVLVWLRLAWRASHRPPALPASMAPRLQWIAHAGHALLYVLMIVIPVSGWLMSSAKGFQTVVFGVLPLPDLLDKDKELGQTLESVHLALNLLLATVVAGHAVAAIKHHVVDHDGVLARMLPWLRPRAGLDA